jgi:hypothetical protein
MTDDNYNERRMEKYVKEGNHIVPLVEETHEQPQIG